MKPEPAAARTCGTSLTGSPRLGQLHRGRIRKTVFNRVLELDLDFEDERVKQVRVDRMRPSVGHGHDFFGLVEVPLGVGEVVQVAGKSINVKP